MVRKKGEPRDGFRTVDCRLARAAWSEARQEVRRATRSKVGSGPLSRILGEEGAGQSEDSWNISEANIRDFADCLGIPFSSLLLQPSDQRNVGIQAGALVARRGITLALPEPPQNGSVLHSPFPGLRALDERDASYFFGRNQQTRLAVQQLKTSGVLWVTGPSGNGKSSLVEAGLIPALKKQRHKPLGWKTAKMTPGRAPLKNLYRALTALFPLLAPGREFSRLIGTASEFVTRIEGHSIRIQDVISQVTKNDGGTDFLLFIDQFEESFALDSAPEVLCLYELIEEIAASKCLYLVATIRHDFLRDLIDNRALAATMNGDTFFNLPLPRRDELREMIEGPAAQAGIELEDGLAERILDDTGDEPGALALMAYSLDELYKSRRGNKMTQEIYEALGGVNGAIRERAEETFQNQAVQESVLYELFGYLVEVNEAGVATRKRMLQEQISSTTVESLLQAFITARLVLTGKEYDSLAPIYEVAHEAVFREWPRLRDWITETKEFHSVISRVEREARNWNRRGRPTYLLPNQEVIEQFYNAEARLFRSAVREEMLEAFLRPEQARLLERLQAKDCNHRERREIGDRLAAIGDTRPGLGLRDGIPDILWVGSKAGSVTIEGQLKHTEAILIGEFPITTTQFNAFLDAPDGHGDARNWTFAPAELQFQSMRSERNPTPNSPRDTVSWYQARAFAKWLDRCLTGTIIKSIDETVMRVIGPESELRLPTEWEWMVAASASEERWPFPWGEWNGRSANTAEAELGRSIAVGMYPNGVAPCGAYDLAGNIAEWCLTNHDIAETDFDLDCSKTLKGGSYYHSAAHAATTFRRRMPPFNSFSNFGFRLIVGPRLDTSRE